MKGMAVRAETGAPAESPASGMATAETDSAKETEPLTEEENAEKETWVPASPKRNAEMRWSDAPDASDETEKDCDDTMQNVKDGGAESSSAGEAA